MLGLATLALAAALPQQAVQHPLPPRTAQASSVVAVVGATLYPVTSPPIERGVMLVEGGRILAMRIQSRNQWRIPVPGILVMLRERLQEAQRYQAATDAYARGERTNPPDWNPQLEALGRALSRELPVGVHAHGVEPMRAAIALKDEFNLDLYIHHADVTVALAEELAEKGIPISFGPVLPSMGRDDPHPIRPELRAVLAGEVSVRFRAQTPEDILAAIR